MEKLPNGRYEFSWMKSLSNGRRYCQKSAAKFKGIRVLFMLQFLQFNVTITYCW